MTAYLGSGAVGPLLFGAIGTGLYLAVYNAARRRYQLNPYQRLKRGMGEQ